MNDDFTGVMSAQPPGDTAPRAHRPREAILAQCLVREKDIATARLQRDLLIARLRLYVTKMRKNAALQTSGPDSEGRSSTGSRLRQRYEQSNRLLNLLDAVLESTVPNASRKSDASGVQSRQAAGRQERLQALATSQALVSSSPMPRQHELRRQYTKTTLHTSRPERLLQAPPDLPSDKGMCRSQCKVFRRKDHDVLGSYVGTARADQASAIDPPRLGKRTTKLDTSLNQDKVPLPAHLSIKTGYSGEYAMASMEGVIAGGPSSPGERSHAFSGGKRCKLYQKASNKKRTHWHKSDLMRSVFDDSPNTHVLRNALGDVDRDRRDNRRNCVAPQQDQKTFTFYAAPLPPPVRYNLPSLPQARPPEPPKVKLDPLTVAEHRFQHVSGSHNVVPLGL
ncbi:hypothetical protein DIPPA_70148 [Diplonema papillatum]|nr:hypothetical protein DIPPA_70148 [Diplonema papillatum]